MPLPLLLVPSLIDELVREGSTTAALLDRVPREHLDWKPHPKSTSLGDLAWHIAALPRRVATMIRAKTFDVGNAGTATREGDDFTAELNQSIAVAKALLGTMDEASLTEPFTITHQGAVVVRMPTAGAIRTIMLNHSVHHRGQLSVYLRMLDVPLPAIYGSSADTRL